MANIDYADAWSYSKNSRYDLKLLDIETEEENLIFSSDYISDEWICLTPSSKQIIYY
jgi:hypothetical protein